MMNLCLSHSERVPRGIYLNEGSIPFTRFRQLSPARSSRATARQAPPFRQTRRLFLNPHTAFATCEPQFPDLARESTSYL
jgi:hypothetical protein